MEGCDSRLFIQPDRVGIGIPAWCFIHIQHILSLFRFWLAPPQREYFTDLNCFTLYQFSSVVLGSSVSSLSSSCKIRWSSVSTFIWLMAMSLSFAKRSARVQNASNSTRLKLGVVERFPDVEELDDISIAQPVLNNVYYIRLAFHFAPKVQKIRHPTQTPRIGTSFWIPIRGVFQASSMSPSDG